MKSISFGKTPAGVAVAVLLVAACGGGGGGDRAPVPPVDPNVSGTDVPTAATTSSTAALAFVKTVAAASADTAEPLRLGDAQLATSDTDEPDPGV